MIEGTDRLSTEADIGCPIVNGLVVPSKDNRLPLVVTVVVPTTVGLEAERAGGLGTEPVVNEIVSDKLEPAELVA